MAGSSTVPPLPSTPDVVCDPDEHYDQTVAVKIGTGEEAQVFHIYRGVLKFYSGYFRMAIKNLDRGTFMQETAGQIDLPDEAVNIFKYFRRWLYSPDRTLATSKATKPKSQNIPMLHICQVYTFAERRIIPLLQNRAIDLIISKMSTGCAIPISIIRYCYRHTAKGSNLRRIIVFYLAHEKKTKAVVGEVWPPAADETWFSEFAQDLVLQRMNSEEYPFTISQREQWSRCGYHVHEGEIRCSSIGFLPS